MASIRTMYTTIAKVNFVVRHVNTTILVHFMVAIGLRASVKIILSHNFFEFKR
jgi:uncharacterized membrane protein YadS